VSASRSNYLINRSRISSILYFFTTIHSTLLIRHNIAKFTSFIKFPAKILTVNNLPAINDQDKLFGLINVSFPGGKAIAKANAPLPPTG
jgi:hypothetical protein